MKTVLAICLDIVELSKGSGLGLLALLCCTSCTQFNEGDVFATGGVTEVVRTARHACYELWPHRFKNPTQHCASHHEEATPRISVPRQARCSKGEVKNLQMKGGVTGLNGSFTPEEMMMMAENLRQALLFLCHGGHIHLRGTPFGQGFINTLQGPLIQSMLSRSLNTTTYADTSKGTDDAENQRMREEVDPTLEISGIAVVKTKTGPVTPLGDVTPEGLRQLLLLSTRSEEAMDSFPNVKQHDVKDILSGVGAIVYTWIEPFYRPPYCRRIERNRYYTFAVPGTVASARVGYLSDVIELAGNFYVYVNWLSRSGDVDDQSILSIVSRSQSFEVLSASSVLEPRHVVHCCDSSCKTLGAGFVSDHGDVNKYLDNGFLFF